MVRTRRPGYLVATIVLGLFAIGYATMAKHITATGAFYGYISHGLGRVVGLASGVIITMAYVVFEGSLIGIFSLLLPGLRSRRSSTSTCHWLVPAILMLTLNCILTYFDVNLAAKVLGVFLVTEIFMLSLGALAVLFQGGGPDGFAVAETLNPDRRLHSRRRHRGRERGTSGCSSPSGRGSASSRRRCTARSPRTRSGSSRAPP